MPKNRKGELIEPLKPIVYYIDPATQKNGENSSNKELTIGKLPSKMLDGKMRFEVNIGQNDPTMSLEDARFSVLRYFAADIQNAYGPNVHDPRTGEILEVTLDGIITL
jgi:hypothetical protein